MGSSGIMLEKKEYLDLDRIVNDVKIAVNIANLQINRMQKSYSKEGEFVEIFVNISEISDDLENRQQLLLNIYDKSNDEFDDTFDWVLKGAKLKHFMDIEDISDCEKIVLDFVYGYLKLNPEDFFYPEVDWYYDYETIKKIKQLPFNKYWAAFPPEVFFDKMAKGEL